MKKAHRQLKNLNAQFLKLFLFVSVFFLTPQFASANLLFDFFDSWEDFLANLMNSMLSLVGSLLWLAGTLFNSVIDLLIINMGRSVERIGSIYTSWEILRDLGNIVIIFGLLAIGIATILRISGYGIKDLLSKLIVVALLINFSFFFTQAIVDVSNYTAKLFYDKMEIKKGKDISDRFVNAMKITTLYSTSKTGASVTKISASNLSSGEIILIGFVGSIVLIITAFSFFAASFLIIIRFGMLIFLMILSPLAFVAMAIPKLSKHATDWWESLFKYALFAPAYLLLVFISLRIIEDANFLKGVEGGSSSFSGAITGAAGETGIIFINFAIIVFFMLASLVIANRAGTMGASSVMDLGGRLRDRARGTVGRNTVGAASLWADRKLEKTRFGKSFVGRGLRNITTAPGASAKYGGFVSAREDREQRIKEAKASLGEARKEGPEAVAKELKGGGIPFLTWRNKEEREEAYASLSPHDRVMAEGEMSEEQAVALRKTLSPDEQRKTESTGRKAVKLQAATEINAIVSDRRSRGDTGENADLTAKVRDLAATGAQELNQETLMDPVVIDNLTLKHLDDIIKDGDEIKPSTIKAITDRIDSVIADRGRDMNHVEEQRRWIHDPSRNALWEVPPEPKEKNATTTQNSPPQSSPPNHPTSPIVDQYGKPFEKE